MSKVGHGVQMCASWVPARNGEIPYNAIPAAHNIYIGRAAHANDVIPCKLAKGHKCAYVPYGGQEISVHNYEVLCNTGLKCFGCETQWIQSSHGQVPPGAIVAGHIGGGEPLYIGRGQIGGDHCVGKVAASHGCAFLPHGGREHKVEYYEVFCCT